MNWDDLRFFLALSREKTVSGAGRVLSVKHTTVARRIAALEQQMGSRLFDRLPSGYAMTQVAENLYKHALAVEEVIQLADREVFGMDAQLSGTLKLTASHNAFSRLVIPQLSQFTSHYPDINLELLTSTGLADLASRQADIALRFSPQPPDYLVGKKVVSMQHGIYASADYLNQHREQDKLILWEQERTLPEWAIQHFSGAMAMVRTTEITTMLSLVKQGFGIARLPCYIADTELELRRINVPLPSSEWALWVLSHVDLRSTARVRVCREFLIDIIEQQRDLIEGRTSSY
ncbi:LysR family transcriptional regulator [Eionea flava]